MNIKDYLHLYLGCNMKQSDLKKDDFVLDTQTLGYLLRNDSAQYKPILRPLSDMTDEEKDEWYNVGQIERLITRTAKIEAESTIFLLSKHFDLFGLIESGLAIDKTTLKQAI